MATFRRKQNRLPRTAYVGREWYFITLNAEDGQPIFNRREVVGFLLETLREACVEHMVDIYAYCLMPNHIHIQPVGVSPGSDLVEFMRSWKGRSTVPLRGVGHDDPFQKGFYDHILRLDDNEDAAAWYIFNNPVRKGLVRDARDWPYSGS